MPLCRQSLHADVVQWQNSSLPSWPRGFDSRHLLHVGTSCARSDFLFYKKSVTRSTVPPPSQKVTLGSPVRLQWLVKPPRPSRRLAVATNFLRICALRRWRFILSHPYNKKSIVRVSVRCSFFIPSARELESFRFRMPTGGPTKGRGLLHNV